MSTNTQQRCSAQCRTEVRHKLAWHTKAEAAARTHFGCCRSVSNPRYQHATLHVHRLARQTGAHKCTGTRNRRSTAESADSTSNLVIHSAYYHDEHRNTNTVPVGIAHSAFCAPTCLWQPSPGHCPAKPRGRHTLAAAWLAPYTCRTDVHTVHHKAQSHRLPRNCYACDDPAGYAAHTQSTTRCSDSTHAPGLAPVHSTRHHQIAHQPTAIP